MLKELWLCCVLLAACSGPIDATNEPSVPVSQYKGYEKLTFKIKGHPCFIVKPRQAAEGKPWLWRASFPTCHDEVDHQLLAEGYHIAFININGMLGSPKAFTLWEIFYEEVREKYQLNQKVALHAVSQGGLFAYRWAKKRPETVACLYAENPVCDFKSWPLGKGKGKGHPATWKILLKEYGMTEEQALDYKDNPLDNLKNLAHAQVPLMHIVTENDQIVPPKENTYPLFQNAKDQGLTNFTIVSLKEGTKKSSGHQFDMKQPEIAVNFIKKYTDFKETRPIHLRDGLQNCRYIFQNRYKARVAFFGGSITEMKGWRNYVVEYLEKKFPDCDIDFVFAGVGSTDSTMGAFRMKDQVFSRGKVDLLFIESAVNELHNGREAKEMERAVEGIVLQARRHNPHIDIVIQYFDDPHYVKSYRQGITPWQVVALERVALQHSINSIEQAKQVQILVDSNKMTEKSFGGVHSDTSCHKVYMSMIKALCEKAWLRPAATQLVAHKASAWQRDPFAYTHGFYQKLETAKIKKGWKIVKNWRASKGRLRVHDAGKTYLEATEPGAELTVEFDGTAIGLSMIAGPDVGVIAYSVDGKPFKKLDQFTRWSHDWHIPWIYMLETTLSRGKHTLTLITTKEKNPKSTGYACRFRFFAVNASH